MKKETKRGPGAPKGTQNARKKGCAKADAFVQIRMSKARKKRWEAVAENKGVSVTDLSMRSVEHCIDRDISLEKFFFTDEGKRKLTKLMQGQAK